MLSPRSPVCSAPDSAFQWCIEVPPPASMRVGAGSAVHLAGWCFHRESAIRNLRLHASGKTTPALAHSLPRPDVRAALYPDGDPNDNSYASGFFAVLPLAGVSALEDVGVFMHLDLQDGREERHLVDLFKALPAAEPAPPSDRPDHAVTICMATHDPPYELFAKQIESIAHQSHSDWRCVISDDRSQPHIFERMRRLLDGDERFQIDRGELRLGAYHNFERALTLVSRDSRYVAFADQDDRWQPEKLEKLLEAFETDTALVYSDCRITSAEGTVLSDTFFARRRNNSSNLRKLLLANTVTGASSMFRADLLERALPFPPMVDPRVSFHDHWIAAVALALGDIRYVDSTLYDYVQHGENIVGHAVTNLEQGAYRGPWMVRSQASYQLKLIRTVLLATALEQRLHGRLARAAARTLHQLSALERSPIAMAMMAAHAIGSPSSSATEGVERDLTSALLWRRRMSRSARKRDRLAHPWYATAPDITIKPVLASDLRGVRALNAASTPISFDVSELHPPQVNLLMHRLELGDVLDNDRGKLVLAAELHAAGLAIRIIAFGEDPPPATDVGVAIVSARDPLPVSPRDVFIATDWLTAYAAHRATARLGGKRFLYVIDECAGHAASTEAPTEPAASYALPHCALFWGERLHDYFRSHRLGVFAAGAQGEAAHATINPAIVAVEAPAAELAGRRPSRLLLHVPSGERSDMFELVLVALIRAADAGALSGWEVNAIGTPLQSVIRLAPDLDVVAVDPVTVEDYAELLRAHDVGISLFPSLRSASVAMEMAAAGLPTITSALDRDDHRWLEARSENLLPVGRTTEELGRGLLTAIARASEPERRALGSVLDQPRTWTETFGPAAIARISSLLASCRGRD